MLLGAKTYLQPTTNLHAQLCDQKIIFQTTKKNKSPKKELFLKKRRKNLKKNLEKDHDHRHYYSN
jgi:hypothetical protein